MARRRRTVIERIGNKRSRRAGRESVGRVWMKWMRASTPKQASKQAELRNDGK